MAKGQKTGGRVAGTPNRITADVKALAQSYVPEVIQGFVELFRHAESEQVRVAAGKELLDRGCGKAVQGVELTGAGGDAIVQRIESVIVDYRLLDALDALGPMIAIEHVNGSS